MSSKSEDYSNDSASSAVDQDASLCSKVERLESKLASAQAELTLEAALERVRSRAMAMHASTEMSEVAAVMYKQLTLLEFPSLRRILVFVVDDDPEFVWMYGSSEHGDSGVQGIRIRLDAHENFVNLGGTDLGVPKRTASQFEGDSMVRLMKILVDAGWVYPSGESPTEKFLTNNSSFRKGSVSAITYEAIEDEAFYVLDRFAQAFDMAYQRFEDLSKAEAQVRGSQIEAALERVRSRSMAMHHSSELMDVVTTLFTEFSSLGVARADDRAYIVEVRDNRFMNLWLTTRGGGAISGSILYDLSISHSTTAEIHKALIDGEEWHEFRLEGPALHEKIFTDARNSGYAETLSDSVINAPQADLPEGLTFVTSSFGGGGLGMVIDRKTLGEESKGIVKRFAVVFGQSYRRFLDLQDAEARTIEVRKQASVDRIRAEIATMRTAEDFERIAPLIWKELETQEISFLRCGLLIVSEHEQVARFYLSHPDGRPLAALKLPFGSTAAADSAMFAWRKNEVWKEIWDRDQFVSWTQEMMEAGQIERPEQYYGSETPPDSIALHFVPFQQGMIYVGAPAELSEPEIEIVRALAQAFSVAYARYDDFRTTEKALKELRVTQKQLVEQEKLASLGSLTAGIAHEIKNPLNFVNNFAEVSAELAQELSEAFEKGETAEVQTILDDLIQNATQITKHGKRADSIVRSMMQHARGGTSERESIEVNEFIEEYVNLAWHGMRARDHGFQAEVVRNYEDDLGSISVLPQEIGRVILNLLNNAFYAVACDDRPGTEQLVTVSTKRTNGSIEITVGDNGSGIPPDVRERIFEPFFTTKPTGEGTGLGLSLSYDIVTKGHGGEMSVGESADGGAEFRIVLPV